MEPEESTPAPFNNQPSTKSVNPLLGFSDHNLSEDGAFKEETSSEAETSNLLQPLHVDINQAPAEDHFVLGEPTDADPLEVAAVKTFHPQKLSPEELHLSILGDAEVRKSINLTQYLSDPASRSAYDQFIASMERFKAKQATGQQTVAFRSPRTPKTLISNFSINDPRYLLKSSRPGRFVYEYAFEVKAYNPNDPRLKAIAAKYPNEEKPEPEEKPDEPKITEVKVPEPTPSPMKTGRDIAYQNAYQNARNRSRTRSGNNPKRVVDDQIRPDIHKVRAREFRNICPKTSIKDYITAINLIIDEMGDINENQNRINHHLKQLNFCAGNAPVLPLPGSYPEPREYHDVDTLNYKLIIKTWHKAVLNFRSTYDEIITPPDDDKRFDRFMAVFELLASIILHPETIRYLQACICSSTDETFIAPPFQVSRFCSQRIQSLNFKEGSNNIYFSFIGGPTKLTIDQI